jgi:hypothetical protein
MRKKLSLLLACVFLLAGIASAQSAPPTDAERQRAIKLLEDSRRAFLDSIKGLSEAQWKFKPDANTWSVAECAEHITVSEDYRMQLVRKIGTQPAQAARPEIRERDDFIIKALLDRSKKAQAPEMLRPSNRWADAPALTKQFEADRAKTIDFMRTTPEDLRGRWTAHPVFKEMDVYQWILLIGAHSSRHTAQINEVKVRPEFPK